VVARVDVAREQVGRVRIGARDEHGGHVEHVGGQTRRDQLLHELARRHEHLAAQMTALLGARQLILEVHARRTRLDHAAHELVGVEVAAEAGLGIGHDGRHPVARGLALEVRDLVGALQRVVDAAHDVRHRVGG
jgi:hypothetical protein